MMIRILLLLNALRSSRRRAESLFLLSLSFPLVQLAVSLFFFAQSRVFVRLFLSSQEKIYRKRKETIRARTAVK